ncbi:MAG: redoxin domain-containing protein [Alphaproteobacteria bacterium]|nr:redoxin domain-containing protein [Alphaproteobacteria bacterium]
MGVEIVGVGFDPPSETAPWVEDEGFPYEIWTDGEDHTLALTYGAADSASDRTPDRVTVILDAEGVLALEYDVTDISAHPAAVLEDCRILFR